MFRAIPVGQITIKTIGTTHATRKRNWFFLAVWIHYPSDCIYFAWRNTFIVHWLFYDPNILFKILFTLMNVAHFGKCFNCLAPR